MVSIACTNILVSGIRRIGKSFYKKWYSRTYHNVDDLAKPPLYIRQLTVPQFQEQLYFGTLVAILLSSTTTSATGAVRLVAVWLLLGCSLYSLVLRNRIVLVVHGAATIGLADCVGAERGQRVGLEELALGELVAPSDGVVRGWGWRGDMGGRLQQIAIDARLEPRRGFEIAHRQGNTLRASGNLYTRVGRFGIRFIREYLLKDLASRRQRPGCGVYVCLANSKTRLGV